MIYTQNFDSSLLTRNILTTLCVLLALSGCKAIGPNFVRPDAPVADQWSETLENKVSHKKVVDDKWWANFNDETLNSLVDTAHQQNLTLQIAGIRIVEARARLGIAIGKTYPQHQQVRVGVSHVGLSDNQPNISPAVDTSYSDINAGFDIGWELDLWGRFKRGVEAADADLMVSVANYDDVMVSLTASVATAYTQIRTFEERLKIAKSNVEIQKSSLHITQVRFKNGVTTELDIQQARSLLLNTQASIPALQIGLQQSKHALSSLLGMLPGQVDALLSDQSTIPTASAEVAVGIPAELLRRRPDIRRAELQATAQSARIGIAEAELYPHFSLIGSIGLRSSDTFNSSLGDLFKLDSLETFAGPSLTWNLFNYGRIKNNVRVQDARLQQLIVAYQDTVLEASREVEDALVAFIRAKQQAELLEQSVEAATRSVDLALLQYRDGAADYQRVLDTQKVLLSQQDRHISKRGDIAISMVTLYKALGGGWQVGAKYDYIQKSTKDAMEQRTNWGGLLDNDLSKKASNK